MWFNFVFWFCMYFRFGVFISVLGFMFLFSQVRSVFQFWVCCILVHILFLHWRNPKKREIVFALCFRLLCVTSGTINYRARIGFHFYAWCTKNCTRKEIRSLHNTKNSYCTTLQRIMHNINNIITWTFQGTVRKPSVSSHSKGWDLKATYRRCRLRRHRFISHVGTFRSSSYTLSSIN